MMSANLRAFLALIRFCEGTSGENGYRTIVGGDLFTDFSDHPRVLKSGVFSSGTPWKSTAAGAYQFLSSTWDECKAALDLKDFSPDSQDKAAVFLIQRRGALHSVEEGNLDQAIQICNKEWASLPGSPYGQPTKSLDACKVIFERAGGTLMQGVWATPPVATPLPTPEPSAPPSKEKSMVAPIVAVLAPLALELLKLLPSFSSGSKVAERNIEVAQKIGPKLIDIAKAVVPGAANEQDAVEQIISNPVLKDAFVAAAAVKWNDIEPFLQFEEESRAKARDFVHSFMNTGPDWKQMGAGVLIGSLSLFIIVGGGFLFWDMMYNPNLDPGQKGLILGALIAAFTTAVGFWFGSSASGRQSGQTVSDIAKSK